MQQQRRHRGFILGLVALGLLVGAALTASPAQAVSGPGPYYAEPAWDQIRGAGRFLVLTNWASAAVLDKETGLVWEKTPTTIPLSWNFARSACVNKTTGNREGWRLPSVDELESLIDSAQSNPALPPGHPFINVQSTFYWSATTFVPDPGSPPNAAWYVHFNLGQADTTLKTLSIGLAWCVRGGNNADQY